MKLMLDDTTETGSSPHTGRRPDGDDARRAEARKLAALLVQSYRWMPMLP